MTFLILFFGVLLSFISILIRNNKTYEPKDPNCPTDVKDAESNKIHMKVFSILGPSLVIISIILMCFGIGTAF